MSAPTLESLQAQISALQSQHADTHRALQSSSLGTGDANSFYLMICGVLVFFMQAGFALLEAGSVRSKNAKNILMKNLLDACIGAIIWWAWGYGVAYEGGSPGDDTGFIGGTKSGGSFKTSNFFAAGYNTGSTTGGLYAAWWFQYVFAAAAATIVSGAMAERTTLIGYLVYTVVITGFIYPVVVYWHWGYGWAYTWNGGMIDFAGSGVVHMTGGIAAITGAAVVGPRKGRFDESKKPIAMPAHNTTFQVLGTFILWVGWYGFNPGSTLGLAGSGQTMARCIVTTTLAAAAGGLTVVIVDKAAISKTWDVGMLCNGILAGLVSITAGTAAVYPWAALILGFLGGFVYLLASKTVLYICKVDDPLDAFAVHGACGFWGVIGCALFAAAELTGGRDGAFYGSGKPLVAGFMFCMADIAWTSALCAAMFIPLKAAGLLRVSAEVEDAGMDVSKHGGAAYSSS